MPKQAERHRLYGIKGSQLIAGLIGFFLALSLIAASLEDLGPSILKELNLITANPFMALFIGILATAIVQSSSTTTTVVVSMVATGLLSVDKAIPFIMGANIGTAVTSTIVALGYISNRDEFELAVAGSTLHGLFNILTAGILFVVELTTHGFTLFAQSLTNWFDPIGGQSGALFSIISPLTQQIQEAIGNATLVCFLGLILLYISLFLFNRALKFVVIGQLKRNLNRYVFDKPSHSLLTGIGTTAMVQSSSVTTSLIVPLIATHKIRLGSAFPFIMGANIGTTTTALLVGLLSSGPYASTGIVIALVHVMFNLIGVAIFYPFPAIRRFPIRLACQLGSLSWQNRLYGVTYVMVAFFVLPFLLIIIGQS